MTTKIQEKTIGTLLDFKVLEGYLLKGDLLGFELELRRLLDWLHDQVTELLIGKLISGLLCNLKVKFGKLGFSKTVKRSTEIQLRTGTVIKVPSLYAKKVPEGYAGPRHLLEKHWGIINKASPLYYSLVGICSAVGPSYDIGNELLMKFGAVQCTSRFRKVAMGLAGHCSGDEPALCLTQEDSLKGKRVVIEIDGGRTRTREWNGKKSPKGNRCFDTPWREPKLFTIRVVNKKGELCRHMKPIYGVRFSDTDMLGLLKDYLTVLGVKGAEAVQVVADGALWIWNSVPALLEGLGVPPGRITKTLDYYHAVSYVNKLLEAMKWKFGKKVLAEKKKRYKEWLWNGQSSKIAEECRGIFKSPSKDTATWINYLDKHESKTQYADYQENNQFCGSGLVESGIRRVINLRFKNPSTFWDIVNVEMLFFLRSTFLSKRWDILMANIINSV